MPPDATGMYSASTLASADLSKRAPRLVVERAPGHDAGMTTTGGGDEEGGCGCSVPGRRPRVPFAPGLVLLAVLGWMGLRWRSAAGT